jgi:Flp pilus assembly protein TadD
LSVVEHALGRQDLLIALALVAVTVAAFAPVVDDPFIRLDDYGYVVDNSHIHAGPTPQALAWAWTTFEKANWHPLTWWSHMIDYRLYGADAGGHHRTNLILHVLNSLVLFALLRKITATRWRSALVAALFAVHPLHVETVAWIAERKDVLSTLFGLLAIGAYAGWTRKGGVRRYATALLLFAASLASKPMLVTLPLVLLLLDYWPLGRIVGLRRRGGIPLKLVVEKIPFLALSGASSVLTVIAQRSGGALADMSALPLTTRAANAAVSYWRYIGKMIWPRDLSIFYGYPSLEGLETWASWQIVAATSGLIAVTGVILVIKRRWAVTGWFVYLGVLVPVIGLVQVGRQSIADRYTYLPLVGLFILVAWGLGELCTALEGRRVLHNAVVVTALLAVVACAVGTRRQVGFWSDSVTLFEHALEVSPESSTVHNNLGIERALLGQWDRAERHFARARDLAPESPEAYFNLGRLLAGRGRAAEAIENLARAVEIHPGRAASHFYLGVALRQAGRPGDAVRHFREAARLDPTWLAPLNQAAWLLATSADAKVRDAGEALRLAEHASRLTDYADANTLDSLSAAFAASGQFEQAVETATRAMKIATTQGNSRKAETLRRRIEFYRQGRPWISP